MDNSKCSVVVSVSVGGQCVVSGGKCMVTKLTVVVSEWSLVVWCGQYMVRVDSGGP